MIYAFVCVCVCVTVCVCVCVCVCVSAAQEIVSRKRFQSCCFLIVYFSFLVCFLCFLPATTVYVYSFVLSIIAMHSSKVASR